MFKELYIQLSKKLLGKKFMPIMQGPLKGYCWSTAKDHAYLKGLYESPEITRLFLSWCKHDTVFYDIGANAGYYSILASLKIIDGSIYAVEPSDANRQLLSRHLQMNKRRLPDDVIKVVPYAITDREREVEFSGTDAYPDGYTYISSSESFRKGSLREKVQGFSIDELINKAYEPPHIIKIDVEGAEYDVLAGAEETIKKYRPKILLATHDCHLPGVKDRCVELLRSWGYEVQGVRSYNKRVEGLEDFVCT